MVTYQEYRAAVERLRRVASESASGVYADVFVDSDKLTIYDAEHDQTQATVEWLESIGFVWDKNDGAMYNGEFAIDPTTRTKRFPIYFKNRFLIDNPTRGDVLTALRLFSKKEGA